MPDSSSPAASTGKKRSPWLRRLCVAAGALVLVVVVLYFIVTSGAFIKGVIIPRVGRALNANLQAGSVSFSPFSRLTLSQVSFLTTGTEPLFQAEELRVHYNLMAILRGHLQVPEVSLTGPRVSVLVQPDGKSNLEPLMKAGAAPSTSSPSKQGPPPKLDIGKVSLTRGAVRLVKLGPGGTRLESEINGLEVSLDGLRTGQTSKLTIGADIAQTLVQTNGVSKVRAKLAGALDVGLDNNLQPAVLKGDVRIQVPEATGVFKDAEHLGAVLSCDVTPSEIRGTSLRFEKAGRALGDVQVKGSLNLAALETHLDLQVNSIDRNLLNLVGTAQALDFLNTKINATSQIDVTAKGRTIASRGKVTVDQFALDQAQRRTPALDLTLQYQVAVNLTDKTASVQQLDVRGRQGPSELLTVALDRPLGISWGEKAANVGDANVSLTLKQLNLADWSAFVGTNLTSGTVALSGQLKSQESGRRLAMDLQAGLNNLSAAFDTNRLEQGSVQCQLQCRISEFSRIQMDRLAVDLSGRLGDFSLRSYQIAAAAEVNLSSNKVEIAGTTLNLRPGGRDAGTLQLSGQMDKLSKAVELAWTLTNLNQNALAPFTGPVLAPRTLSSCVLGGGGRIKLDAAGDIHTQMSAALTRMVLNGVDGKALGAPLDAQLELDLTQSGMRTDLRRLALALPPTARARNGLLLAGRVDLSRSNAIPSSLNLSSDGLDLTPLYDLITSNQPPAQTKSQSSARPAAASASAGDAEPDAVKLQIEQLRADLRIDRLYLREIAISNFVASAEIKAGEVNVRPLQLTLNGAPVSSTVALNLSQPGYIYGLDLSVDRLPLEPLANSVAPEKRGQVVGELLARAQVRGAGVTGASLRKNLQGQAVFALTNLNLQALGPRARSLLLPIAVLLRADDLLESPLNFISAEADIGAGKVNLKRAEVASPAFFASSQGVIELATVLTNSSLNLPVQFALRRSLAEKIKYTSGQPWPNAGYSQFPQFVKIAGTVGNPKTETDKTKVLGVLAQGVGGAVGGQAGEVVQGIGNVLQGGNPLKSGSLTNLLPLLKGGTNTNAAGKVNPLDLLRGLGPK